MGAKEDILERFAALTPKLQAVARYIVDHPNEVVVRSMRSLAEASGEQPASFVRLAQQLGYAGWPELKAAFAEEMGLNSRSYGQRAQKLSGRGSRAALVGEMFDAQRRNLVDTEQLCAATLAKAAARLARAQAVHVAGFRASFPIAYSFAYGYRLFRPSVQLVDGLSGGLEMQLRAIGRQDCLVAISFAPYSREALMAVAAARQAGAGVIALTDSHASPLALQADAVVLFAAASPSFFPSIAAAVAVTEGLLELLVADAPPGVAARIDRAEQQLFESGAYLQPPR